MTDLISRQAAIDAIQQHREGVLGSYEYDEGVAYAYAAAHNHITEVIERLPSEQPEWDNHTVACLLAELFDDTCACNYNGIDEWLPGKCELLDSCPNPVGVACWEQFLKHKAEEGSEE